jgi:hypothetical protein
VAKNIEHVENMSFVRWTMGTMDNKWPRLLAYATGLVNQELFLQNEYLAAENRMLSRNPRVRWVGCWTVLGGSGWVGVLQKGKSGG